MNESKACRDCGEVKPLDDFQKMPSARDGRRNRCKACGAVYARAYRTANLAAIKAGEMRYRAENRERLAQRVRERKAENPELFSAHGRRYYRKNAGRINERARAWAKANPERVRQRQHAWTEKNREKVNAKIRNRFREESKLITPAYAKRLLRQHESGIPPAGVPAGLIEAMRAHLQLKRYLEEIER
jgi:hypothetical protein